MPPTLARPLAGTTTRAAAAPALAVQAGLRRYRGGPVGPAALVLPLVPPPILAVVRVAAQVSAGLVALAPADLVVATAPAGLLAGLAGELAVAEQVAAPVGRVAAVAPVALVLVEGAPVGADLAVDLVGAPAAVVAGVEVAAAVEGTKLTH